ncbi:MAG: hypothetical protein ACPGUF_01110 [Litorivicinus sp.]
MKNSPVSNAWFERMSQAFATAFGVGAVAHAPRRQPSLYTQWFV